MKGVFFIAETAAGISAVENAKNQLENKGLKVECFMPIGESGNSVYALENAMQMIAGNKSDELIEKVITAYKQIASKCDVVLVDGCNVDAANQIGEFQLKQLIAKHLCLPVVLVTGRVAESADFVAKSLARESIDVVGVLSNAADLPNVLDKALQDRCAMLSSKMFEANLAAQAASDKQRIVLPEGECDRVLKAAADVARQGIANLIILGNSEKVLARAKELNISLDGVDIVDYTQASNFEDYAQTLCELRKAKGMTIEEARTLMNDGAYYGTMMVYKGDADGMVSGAEHTTANTIRPALQFVKTKPGVTVVSGAFLMCMNGHLHVYADCAVTPNPTPEQLSEIAITTAQTARLFGLDPKVAFLSYGTGESGKGPSVDAVKEAVRITQEKNVDFKFEGPIQFDAAVDPDVAKTKLPNSEVAGHANVFVFPELNTGNCCYKAVQRSLGDECLAVGPVLQGLNKPVNDLSRGATVQDIINTIAFTAVQAQTK